MDRSNDSHRDELHAYDPERGEPPSDACADALEATMQDGELRAWWEEECCFDKAMKSKLREACDCAPADLAARICAAAASEESKIVRPPRSLWHWSAFSGAAAAVMLLAVLYTFVFNPLQHRSGPTPELQALMARLEQVLDERSVEMHRSSGFDGLVQHLNAAGAPTPKFIPAGLPQEGGFACANMVIDGIPVGMMCFKVENGVYHIFTIDREALPDQSDLPREFVQTVDDHSCAIWTREDQIYILATKESEEKLATLL